MLFFLMPEMSMDMDIQWIMNAPCTFGIQGYSQVHNFYVRWEGEIIFKDLRSIYFSLYIHIFCDVVVTY